MSAKPFHIAVPEPELERLRRKLEAADFPGELENAEWGMGVPLDEVKRLVTYWRDGFDWRKQESKLNDQFPQFTLPVSVTGYDDLDIHFLHQTSQTPGAIPLLFIHGWPGSFLEATKLIPLLTRGDKNSPVFNVVAPSLPNFGFSSGVKKKGFGLKQYAEAMHGVMSALGYKEYVVQGGDWGSMISRLMASQYPEHVKAMHLNFIPMRPPALWKHPIFYLQQLLTVPFSSDRKAYFASVTKYLTKGNGYMVQQSTRPQTLGYGLHDSPVALLTWIYDKLHEWTDNYPWTDDEILTWVSIYLFSAAGPAASVRIYYEAAEDGSLNESMSISAPNSVKVGVAQFKKEIMKYHMSWASLLGSVVRMNEYDVGGHFAAWEVPDLLADDLKRFLGKGSPAYGAVFEKDGF